MFVLDVDEPDEDEEDTIIVRHIVNALVGIARAPVGELFGDAVPALFATG